MPGFGPVPLLTADWWDFRLCYYSSSLSATDLLDPACCCPSPSFAPAVSHLVLRVAGCAFSSSPVLMLTELSDPTPAVGGGPPTPCSSDALCQLPATVALITRLRDERHASAYDWTRCGPGVFDRVGAATIKLVRVCIRTPAPLPMSCASSTATTTPASPSPSTTSSSSSSFDADPPPPPSSPFYYSSPLQSSSPMPSPLLSDPFMGSGHPHRDVQSMPSAVVVSPILAPALDLGEPRLGSRLSAAVRSSILTAVLR